MIVKRQEGKSWGKAVVVRLAADLQMDFSGVGGFLASNLWQMKSFFEAYVSSEKLAPLVREIAWGHNLIILERCTDPLEREFYFHRFATSWCSSHPSPNNIASSPRWMS